MCLKEKRMRGYGMILTIELILITIMSICLFYYLSWNSSEEIQVIEKIKKIPKKSSKTITWFMVIMTMLTYGTAVYRNIMFETDAKTKEIKLIIMLVLLIPMVWTDYHKHIIPNQLVLCGLVIRGIIYVFEACIDTTSFLQILKNDLCGALFIVIVTLIGGAIIKGGIGYGDVKLLGLMALFQGISGMLMSVLLSLSIMFFFALYYLFSKKKGKKDCLPFAPAAFAGTLLSMVLTTM